MKVSSIIVCVYFLCGCKNSNSKETIDKFYSKTNSSWDASRIPLIKPYEMIELNGTDEWDMNLVESPGSISNIKDVNVFKNIIAIHADSTYCNNSMVKEGWFIIIPERHVEKCFQEKAAFDEYFATCKINKPKLYNIDSISNEYRNKKNIEWQ